jgi:hypothetical protein
MRPPPSPAKTSLLMGVFSLVITFSFRTYISVPSFDYDFLRNPFHFGPGQIDRQEPVLQIGSFDFDSLRQNKGLLKLAGGNAPVQVFPGRLFLLPAADDEFVLLHGHVQLIEREARYGERDSQGFGPGGRLCKPLDVVGGISVPGRLGEAVKGALDFLETQEERA